MHPNDGLVVSNFIVQAFKREDITIYGKGEKARIFCYVSDLIGVLIKLMEKSDGFTGLVNLGIPTELTIYP